jgi:2'-5' RNA ligase
MAELRYTILVHIDKPFCETITTLRTMLERSPATLIPDQGRVNLHEAPHITMLPPFVAKKDQELRLLECFNTWSFPAETISSSSVGIAHWTRTGSVPYINWGDQKVLHDMYASLTDLFKGEWVYSESSHERKFQPHTTIVYGTDADEAERINKAAEKYFPFTETLAKVSLCRIHPEAGWEVIATKKASI